MSRLAFLWPQLFLIEQLHLRYIQKDALQGKLEIYEQTYALNLHLKQPEQITHKSKTNEIYWFSHYFNLLIKHANAFLESAFHNLFSELSMVKKII